MKKYKIRFTADYLKYEEWAKNGDTFWKRKVEDNPEEVEQCRKWKDKEITILELEELINEFGSVVFDGCTIEIYNDYRE
jgi:hypothetical protein